MYYTQVYWAVINNTKNKVNRFSSNVEHMKNSRLPQKLTRNKSSNTWAHNK